MITPPHVVFVTPSAYTLGGLATWLDYLLPGLVERGWRATLGLVAGPRHHRPADYLAQHPWDDTVTIFCGTGTEQGRRTAMRRAIQRLRPDVVCTVNIPDALAAVAELRAAGSVDTRAVMTCHGIQEDLFRDMQHCAASLDAVFCTNRLACALTEERLNEDDIDVLYVPYGTHVPDRQPRDTTEELLSLAYIGRFEESQKRISDVVAIVRGLVAAEVPFRLLVAGAGPDESSFRQALESCLRSDQLMWHGQVPAAELSEKIYQQADVLLLTSRWETGPIVVWEALAHEVVVVSSRYIGSGREGALRDRDNSLLFDIGDTGTASDAVAELARDRGLRSRLSAAGRQMVQSRYTIERSVSRWDAALRSVLERPLRPLTPPEIRSAGGRLTRLVGPRWAERLRGLSGRLPPDSGPGGEWPHTLSGGEEEHFWSYAGRLDREDAPQTLVSSC